MQIVLTPLTLHLNLVHNSSSRQFVVMSCFLAVVVAKAMAMARAAVCDALREADAERETVNAYLNRVHRLPQLHG